MEAVIGKGINSATNRRARGGQNSDRPLMVSELEGLINLIVNLSSYLKADGSVVMTGLLELSGDPTQPLNPVTKQFLDATIALVINGAPANLNTLAELATAINNDPAFSTTINNLINALTTRTSNLEANEFKITYYLPITTATGTITKPIGSTILLDQYAGGVDALVSTMSSSKPTGVLPKTAGGVDVDVATFDALGNYTLTGTPSPFAVNDVCLIFVIKISALNLANALIENRLDIQETDITPGTVADFNTGSNNSRYATPLALEASKYLNQSGTKISCSLSGTNSYTGTIAPAITGYANGQRWFVKASADASGVCTINLNSLGVKKWYKNPTTQCTTGDVTINQIYIVAYDTTLDSGAGGFLMCGGGGGAVSFPGTGDRMVEANAAGTTSASKLIVDGYITDATLITALQTAGSWAGGGGSSAASYTSGASGVTGGYQGQYYIGAISGIAYLFLCKADQVWVRVSISDIAQISEGGTSASVILTASGVIRMNAAGTAFENSGFTLNQNLGTGNSVAFNILTVATRIVTGAFSTNVGTAKTSAYTLSATTENFMPADATTAGFTITLPTAVGNSGLEFTIFKIDSTANLVTIATTSSQTINGATTYTLLNAQYKYVRVKSNGANWYIVGAA